MGVDIVGGPSLNWSAWRYCLDMALQFGWEPAGTVLPEDCPFPGNEGIGGRERAQRAWQEARSKWRGSYTTNDFQLVTEPDAKALAKALYVAIAAVQAGTAPDCDERHCVQSLRMLADHAVCGGFQIS